MRIAVLGGTFDPVHNGHLTAAHSVSATFRTDQVQFVPAYSAPHKRSHGTLSAFHRFAMVALATAPFERFKMSTIEVEGMDKCYTVDTLERLRAETPGAELIFVLGTDMYQDFETWKDYRRLFALSHMAVVHRPGFDFRKDLAPHRVVQQNEQVALPRDPAVFYLPFVEQNISSTAVRESCRRGEDASQWVPPPVWDYIEKHKLYS